MGRVTDTVLVLVAVSDTQALGTAKAYLISGLS